MSPCRRIPGINLCLAFEIRDVVLKKMDAPKKYWKEWRADRGGLCSGPGHGCRVVNVVGWLRSDLYLFFPVATPMSFIYLFSPFTSRHITTTLYFINPCDYKSSRMSFLVSSEGRSLYPQETDGRSSQQTFHIIAENCRNWFWFTPHGEHRVCTEHLHLLLPLWAAKAGLLTLPPHSSWAGNDALQKMQSHGFASTLSVILLWGHSLKNF